MKQPVKTPKRALSSKGAAKNGGSKTGNGKAARKAEVKPEPKAETKKEKRDRLLAEREVTVLELGRLREQMKTEIEHDTEDGDPEVYEREKLMAIIRTLEEKLTSIDYAQKALEQGVYGICERCGNEIGSERLKAIPDTTLCVKCKAETEKLLKRGFAPA